LWSWECNKQFKAPLYIQTVHTDLFERINCNRIANYMKLGMSSKQIKDLMGTSHMKWDVNRKQGAYAGQKGVKSDMCACRCACMRALVRACVCLYDCLWTCACHVCVVYVSVCVGARRRRDLARRRRAPRSPPSPRAHWSGPELCR